MYVRCVIVLSERPDVINVGCVCVCVCVCVYVCVPRVPVLVKSGHRVYDQISPGQELQAHTHTHTTDDNKIQPHTIQEHNEHTSTNFYLVTA
jgi:hypothetical protein